MKIIAISGSERSGGALVSVLLSQPAEAFNLGRMRELWTAYAGDLHCSCGVGLRRCAVHGRAVPAALAETSTAAPEAMEKHARAFLQAAEKRTDWGDPEARAKLRVEHAAFLAPLGATLRHVAAQTGALTFIEGSRLPAMALAFDLLEDVDLRVLNLLRDPRAVAIDAYRGTRRWSAALQAVTQWKQRQRRLESWRHGLGPRYMALRYEDFVTRPRDQLMQALQFAGLPMPDELFAMPDKVRLSWEGQHLCPPDGHDFLTERPQRVTIRAAADRRGARVAPLWALAVAASWPELRRHYLRRGNDAGLLRD